MSDAKRSQKRYFTGRKFSSKHRTGGVAEMGVLVGAALAKSRLGYGVKRAQAMLLWPKAVGPEIARITKPRSQYGETLYIEVRDSATAHHLTMQRHHFLRRLQHLLEDQSVTELRFSVGSIKAPPDAPRAAPLPTADRQRAKELVRGLENMELQAVALRTAEAITRARKWRIEQGWRSCPVCGEPTAEQPCRACRLTMQDPNVRRAAKKLMYKPELLEAFEGTLGDSGTKAACYLALAELREQLEELALECVRNGHEQGYYSFLVEQSKVYLCLKLKKSKADLAKADEMALPIQIQQVLHAG